MTSGPTQQMVDAITNQYTSGGKAAMGVTAFNSFSPDDVDLFMDADEVPTSVATAGAKTFLAGALFGADMTLHALDASDEDLDHVGIVQSHEEAIEESVATGLADVKRKTLEKLLAESNDE